MSGSICLQGGHEFTSGCRDMDAAVLALTGRRVAVLAGAARVGQDYEGASERARRHYRALDGDVTIVPDPRGGEDASLAVLNEQIDVLVLPGGSPGSLLDVLEGAVRDRIIALHGGGMSISGASAGAMVLCTRTVRPDLGGDVVDGLGLVDGLALPHWEPGPNRWNVPDITLWGLPECGGVVFDDRGVTAVGQGEPSVRRNGVWEPLPRS